jgi:hypothetical protein
MRTKLLTPCFDPGPSWEHRHFADEALKEAIQDLLASADDTRCIADLTVASAYALTKVKHILAKTPWPSAPRMRSFIADELCRSDAANAKLIRPTDY